MTSKSKKLSIAFLHPDLGLGGAERLVVDAAYGLAKKGHQVTIYTSHYNEERSFAETRDGLIAVKVAGDFLPRHFFGKFHILFATLRAIFLAFYVCFFTQSVDIFICDQIAAYVPILRIFRFATPVLFYLHFPDALLSIRTSFLKKLYRIPFDLFEELCTGFSSGILVNSEFTKRTYMSTFKILAAFKTAPSVLYPCMNTEAFASSSSVAPNDSPRIFLSINRFERKKAIELAIQAASILDQKASSSPKGKKLPPFHLIVAGGYDVRVPENVQVHSELAKAALDAGLFSPAPGASLEGVLDDRRFHFPTDKGASSKSFQQIEKGSKVSFLRSFSDEQKRVLLEACSAVIYTPSNEHFGIVPLECMAASRPVIAVASGGPLESVVDGKTGFLCDPTASSFADAMEKLLADPKLASKMGTSGNEHVNKHFSRVAFVNKLETACNQLIGDKKIKLD
jgi:alpha-1,3/alpha-1,6-mannosyltransferase